MQQEGGELGVMFKEAVGPREELPDLGGRAGGGDLHRALAAVN